MQNYLYINIYNENEEIINNLDFFKVDYKKFPAFRLKPILNKFISIPIVLNAANEIFVDQFLKKNSIILIDDINFDDVYNGTLDFINKTKSKYEILKEIKTANNHCHPSYWNGILILRKN